MIRIVRLRICFYKLDVRRIQSIYIHNLNSIKVNAINSKNKGSLLMALKNHVENRLREEKRKRNVDLTHDSATQRGFLRVPRRVSSS